MRITPKCTNLRHKKSSRRSGSVESTTAYSLVVKRSFRVDLYAPKVHNFFFLYIPLDAPYKIHQRAYASVGRL